MIRPRYVRYELGEDGKDDFVDFEEDDKTTVISSSMDVIGMVLKTLAIIVLLTWMFDLLVR
jgi:hypothetical protein